MRGGSVLITAAVIVIAAGLKASQDIMVPFLLSAFIATIAATPMFALQRRGVPSAFSLPAVMVLMIIIVGMMGALVAQSASEFTAKLPAYQARIETFQTGFIVWIQPLIEPLGVSIDLQTLLANFSPGSALELAGSTLARLGSVLSNSFLIVLTVIFILAEAASFPRKLTHILKDPDRDLEHFSLFAANMNRYIAIKTSVSVATGVLVTIILMMLGVDFPMLWGLLAFLLNYVPNIGSIIAAVPPVHPRADPDRPGAAGAVALAFFGINIVHGQRRGTALTWGAASGCRPSSCSSPWSSGAGSSGPSACCSRCRSP